MKTFVHFTEDIAQRRIELKQRSDANVKSYYDKIRAHKKSVEDAKERDQEKENLKKKLRKSLQLKSMTKMSWVLHKFVKLVAKPLVKIVSNQHQ